MRKWKNHTKLIVNIITAILVVFLCVGVIFLQKKEIPENPIADHQNQLQAETMAVSGSSLQSEDSSQQDESLDSKTKKGDKQQDKLADTEKKQNRSQGNDSSSKTEKSEKGDKNSSLDGINTSDRANDQEGDGKTGEESVKPSDRQDTQIATDLKNQIITKKQLSEDQFDFYAYLVHPEDGMKLKVKLRNSQTRQNGEYLSGDGKNYQTKLAKGFNYITLYIKKGNETSYQITYAIQYMADKADEKSPEVGEHPPTITTNLDGFKGVIKNKNFLFTVEAKTYTGKYLPYDYIRVTYDGKTVTFTPTGDGVYEYELYFKSDKPGETSMHTVTVLAWDEDGNSAYKTYKVAYQDLEEGAVIGHATITIDATTLGKGIVASGYQCDIRQGEPASYAVVDALEAYGLTPVYSGTKDAGFYLRGISGGKMGGANIPSNLWQKILDDGLTTTSGSSGGAFEFDYTQGSGWMYSINGSLYPGRGMSNYYLNNGDNVILRFTLAYGKDLGSTSSRGLLNSYCGAWINGGYTPMHRYDSGKTIVEATCESSGQWAKSCTVKGCTEQIVQTIPALGHDYKEVYRDEEVGQVTYQCSRCGKTETEFY